MRIKHILFICLAIGCVAGVRSQSNEVGDGGDESSPRCMEKVEMEEKTEWETKIKCHHSYRQNCYQTYQTSYVPTKETECSDDYEKSCSIEYEKQARDLQIQICHQPLERNCDVEGTEVCTTEWETVCETEISAHVVQEDVPECKTEFENRCMEDPRDPEQQICADIPRQVCKLKQEEHTKAKPISKCERIRTEVCGSEACPLVQGEEVCEMVTRTVLDDVPVEVCELSPQKVCKDVSRLVPRLTAVTRCVPVPKEICVKMRVNPRRVRRPVVKLWCTEEPR